eukprot:CAMPEP_0171931892 /NCGR_PEP_ID=MMETSP0993-20121228/29854_1 /TAXON_ID=483369 /ORGANISM="non described non described, Strain CCMP2098" /LENGTH=31 /DNA_ID= /DNA_START= /DNA_END= /DNA_ORIENTATION=
MASVVTNVAISSNAPVFSSPPSANEMVTAVV